MHIYSQNSKPAILGGEPLFRNTLYLILPEIASWDDIKSEMQNIFDTTILTKGPKIKEFESQLSDYLNVKNVISMANCTAGLMLSYKLLGFKGEVILPSFTFIATGSALLWQNNITPVFVDIDRETFNIDIKKTEAAITPNTSAIVGVHVFGNPANIEELEQLAKKNNLKLVFDSAHALGGHYKGKSIGNFGDTECFSCSPTKLLITGEGGLVTTNDDELAEKLRIAREYGNPGNYDSIYVGMNARMSELHAAIGMESIKKLDYVIQKRNQYVEYLKERLSELPGIRFQKVHNENLCTYKDFALVIEDEFELSRDQLAQALKAENIETRNYFSPPLHLQTTFKPYLERFKDKLPETENLSNRALTIPLSSKFTIEQLDLIALGIEKAYTSRNEIAKLLSS
jgi:dTDP-4-amino-4,6-dideoxygalactose transaminase